MKAMGVTSILFSLLIFLYGATVGQVTGAGADCPVDFIRHGDYCWLFVKNANSSWNMAKSGCEDRNSSLASVIDSNEYDFVANRTEKLSPTAIGLRDISFREEKIFTWIDGSTSLYRAWNVPQPQVKDNKCVYFWLDSFLSGSCEWVFDDSGYICKHRAGMEVKSCKNGFYKFNGQCWQFEKGTNVNWLSVKDKCIQNNSFLASIHTEEERLFVNSSIPGYYFMGLNDIKIEGNFSWIDNSPYTSALQIHRSLDTDDEADCSVADYYSFSEVKCDTTVPQMYYVCKYSMDWTIWSQWNCDVTCGNGTQVRTRTCTSHSCSGHSSESKGCYNHPCQDSLPAESQRITKQQCSTHIGLLALSIADHTLNVTAVDQKHECCSLCRLIPECQSYGIKYYSDKAPGNFECHSFDITLDDAYGINAVVNHKQFIIYEMT